MNQQSQTTYSITQVSNMSGVSKNRIREWHEKGFLPEVQLISVGSRDKNTPYQRVDPLDQRNRVNITWIDRDDKKEDPDYQSEIVFDTTNPENLLIAKETLSLIHNHFTKPEIEYLMGEIDLCEAAKQVGISIEAFRKRLDRRKVDFKEAILAMNSEQ